MKIYRLALAAALLAGVASPAAADWDKIDSVNVTHGADRDSVSPEFGGPVEKLRFTARESAVQCASINAVLGNGTKVQLFSGRIAQGASRSVDLPGERRTIAKLNFRCHALDKSGGRIVVDADVGRYRSVWMKSPTWNRFWANLWGGNWDQAINYWVYVGKATFTGRSPVENTFAGWAGRSVNAIGIRPLNDDARCGKLQVTFKSGRTAEYDIDRSDLLRENRTYRIDLPGGDRDVASIKLRCRPEHYRSVAISIYANK